MAWVVGLLLVAAAPLASARGAEDYEPVESKSICFQETTTCDLDRLCSGCSGSSFERYTTFTTGRCTPCPGEDEDEYHSEHRYGRGPDSYERDPFTPYLEQQSGLMRCLSEWNDVYGAPRVGLPGGRLVGPIHLTCELDGGCGAPWCDKVSLYIHGLNYYKSPAVSFTDPDDITPGYYCPDGSRNHARVPARRHVGAAGTEPAPHVGVAGTVPAPHVEAPATHAKERGSRAAASGREKAPFFEGEFKLPITKAPDTPNAKEQLPPSAKAPNAPRGQQQQEAPTDKLRQEAPTDKLRQEAPTDKLQQEAPTDKLQQEAPTDKLRQEAPTDKLRQEAPTDKLQPAGSLRRAARAAYSSYRAGNYIGDDTPVWVGDASVWVGTMTIASEHRLPYSVGKFRYELFVGPNPEEKTWGDVHHLPGLTVINPWMYQFKFLKSAHDYY